MSASSRSTIFSLRSKKSKDSTELHLAQPYENLPMSPRLPISVPTIVPPSQQVNGGRQTIYEYDDDAASDAYSVRSEPRSRTGGSLGGPRPLPPRSGSAEKMYETASSKHSTIIHESPNVFPTCPNFQQLFIACAYC